MNEEEKEEKMERSLIEDILISIDPVYYKEKEMYDAKMYCAGWAECAIADTAEEAVGIVLQKMGQVFLDKKLTIENPPEHNSALRMEVLDIKWEKPE